MFLVSILLLFLKVERSRVHTISQTRWFWTIIEYMPQMCAASGTLHFGANHAVGRINDFEYVFWADGLVETGPARTRIKFGRGLKQRRGTAHAVVDACGVVVVIFARKSPFGAALSGYAKLDWRKDFFPFLVGFYDRKGVL